MQSNPMELIETSWVGRDQVKLSSEEESTWRPPTCVITHWKQMTNVNVFTNVIHPKSCGVFQRFLSIPTILGLNLSSYQVAPAKSVLATICCRLLLIGMLLEYYCEAGWGIVQVSLHCYPSDPVARIRHGQLAPKLGPVWTLATIWLANNSLQIVDFGDFLFVGLTINPSPE